MELLRLKRRTLLAKKGHKLLKDKLDGLIRHILEIVRTHQHLSAELEIKLTDAFTKLALSSAQTKPDIIRAAAERSTARAGVSFSLKNIMGVKIPAYSLELEGDPVAYDFSDTTGELDRSLIEFMGIVKELVKLAEYNKAILTIASKIIEIKRRVNALEYRLIPELEASVAYIRMKLSEMERSTIVTLLKIKDIVRAK